MSEKSYEELRAERAELIKELREVKISINYLSTREKIILNKLEGNRKAISARTNMKD